MCCPYNYCLRLHVKWLISILLLCGNLSFHVWTIPSFICRTNLGMYCWFVNGFLRLELSVWCVKQLKLWKHPSKRTYSFLALQPFKFDLGFTHKTCPFSSVLDSSPYSHTHITVKWSKQELCTTHPPNQELHTWPHVPRFYHNNTLLYCILSF